jgi:hypothetical protein
MIAESLTPKPGIREHNRHIWDIKLAEARKVAAEAITADADQHAANVMPIIREIQRTGSRSLRAIATALNARGVATARGGRWQAQTVSNVLARAWPAPRTQPAFAMSLSSANRFGSGPSIRLQENRQALDFLVKQAHWKTQAVG